MLRFHTQTAGNTLTAQQIDNNIVRVTIQALAAVLMAFALPKLLIGIIAGTLVDAANAAGGRDNISVVLLVAGAPDEAMEMYGLSDVGRR